MKNTITETTRLLLQGNLTKEEADKILLDLYSVSGSVFDDKIDEWHESDSNLPLYEYIGLTKEKYLIWLKNPNLIEKDYR
tara:strand:- start:690 stop:929 length:240 start_codon:yes stop_codon:yes gene_type:complete